MEAKRRRVSDLLHAQVGIKEITDIIGCHRSFVYKVKNMMNNGDDLSRKPGSGGHNKKVDEDFLTGLSAEIEADPTRSMRKLAKDLNVSEWTIRQAVGELGLHSYVRRRRQLLSNNAQISRVECGKKVLNWLKKKPASVVLVFSDKKNWTVDQAGTPAMTGT